MSNTATIVWFARHELRLAWRDWLWMMTAGRAGRACKAALLLTGFVCFMHFLAFSMVGRYADIGRAPDKTTLIVITGSALLAWCLMVSQAMESVTRAFYSRSDLDLILSSPIVARKLFSVRIGAIAVSVALMALLLASPFINVLVVLDGPRWLGAYGMIAAMAAVAAALAVALTVALFRTIGPKRTRLVAQVVAAVIGAAFVIGLQVGAITSFGTLSRFDMLKSDALLMLTPDTGSIMWWPARAILGDVAPLAAVLAAGLAILALATIGFAGRFGEHAAAAAGVSSAVTAQRHRSRFRGQSSASALRRKEWTLLRRDPWLVSQSLMQILYLVPPAVLLWRSFGRDANALVLLAPVLVMAAGQLAGGLAWLAISGEDAPDLVATAPVPARRIVRAKIEAVIGAVALVFTPFVIAFAALSLWHAAVTALGVLIAASASTQIQLWFRSQAKRAHFRRRHTASRTATFAEALSSVTWAAATGMAAAALWVAAVPAAVAIIILIGARLISPRAD